MTERLRFSSSKPGDKVIVRQYFYAVLRSNRENVGIKQMMVAGHDMTRLAADGGEKDGIVFGIVWNNPWNWLRDNDDRCNFIQGPDESDASPARPGRVISACWGGVER